MDDPDDTPDLPPTVLLVSDFFYPAAGGVEEHIASLAQCLLESNCARPVVVTHSHEDRKGVRYMANGLKVYYVPAQVFYNGAILPNMVTLLPLLRQIIIREDAQIVHGHGAFSSLAHDALFAAKLLNRKTVFTDHSLFGFADASAIVTNRFLQISLADVDHCICVSHTGKANTVLRANIPSERVSVIPNAVDTAVFRPPEPHEDFPPRPPGKIVVIILSRLVYRKGVDLMVGVIPIILAKHPYVTFKIGGDGPKRLDLEELRESWGEERISLVGKMEHSRVRSFLCTGDLFLNPSLTEAFCMAIVEAAAVGLSVVSTRVGGIPEVLPSPQLITLADPTVPSLVGALDDAIRKRLRGEFVPPTEAHAMVAGLYNWRDVARRTEVIYGKVLKRRSLGDGERMKKYIGGFGSVLGPLFCLVLGLGRLIMALAEWKLPTEEIDIAVQLPPPRKRRKIL